MADDPIVHAQRRAQDAMDTLMGMSRAGASQAELSAFSRDVAGPAAEAFTALMQAGIARAAEELHG